MNHHNDDDRIPWGIVAFFGVVGLLGLSILIAKCAHAEPVNLACTPEAFLVPPPPPGPEPRTGVHVWCFWDEDETDPNADPNSFAYFVDRAPGADPNAWQARYRDTNPRYAERQFLDIWAEPVSTYRYRISYGTAASASNVASATTPASVPIPTSTTVTTSTTTTTTTSTTLDVVPPPIPPNLRYAMIDCHEVRLDWDAVTDIGMGTADYRVFQWKNGNWAYFATVTDPSLGVVNLVAGVTYYWCVAAVDGAGNQSPLSGWVATVMPSCETTTSTTATTSTTTATTSTTTTTTIATTTTVATTSTTRPTTTTTRPSTTTTTLPCRPDGASCSTGSQCCSGSCGGAWWKRTCR